MTDKFVWSERSLEQLEGIHPDLRKVCDLALELSTYDFTITDGLRTIEEQRDYVARGVSWTMNSRHLTGHAIDFAVIMYGKCRWEMSVMQAVAAAFMEAARQLGVDIDWGGDWKSKDTPHIELNRKAYPA